jgi:hypothetical protein
MASSRSNHPSPVKQPAIGKHQLRASKASGFDAPTNQTAALPTSTYAL